MNSLPGPCGGVGGGGGRDRDPLHTLCRYMFISSSAFVPISFIAVTPSLRQFPSSLPLLLGHKQREEVPISA